MSTAADLRFPWKRFWIPQGKTPTVSNGYFVAPDSEMPPWMTPASNGASLHSLRDVPCLVLLGDVGMGKSTVVADEAESLRLSVVGQDHEVVLCDLKGIHHTRIVPHVFGNAAVKAWINGKSSLTLFVDSLDECWRRVEELESILVGELETFDLKSKPPLFLRFACRSAEWRGEVGKTLGRLFPQRSETEAGVRIFLLAPLSVENIHQAAEAVERRGEELIEAIATIMGVSTLTMRRL